MTLHYAFVDESGGIDASGEHDWCLVVAAIACQTPRPLELLMKQAFKQFGASPAQAEFKAARSSEKTIYWLLRGVANLDTSIVVVAADGDSIRRMPKDPETIYRRVTARVARLLVEKWPQLDIVIDKRYTHEHLRRRLERTIREEIAEVPGQVVVIRHEDSRHVRSLQVADLVAWACWQHRNGMSRFYDVISNRVVAEEKLVPK